MKKWKVWALALAITCTASSTIAQDVDNRDARIAELERMVKQLADEVQKLKSEQVSEREERVALEERVDEQSEMAETESLREAYGMDKLDIAGYAEIHANFNEGSQDDVLDIHRFVLDFKYDFSEWIKFHSELEIEHAFISGDDGEIYLEQFYVDFLFNEYMNVRAGRVLTPMGIINQHHEPNRFNGVERPNVDRTLIPSTWTSDGVGIFGNITESLNYELYVVGGLDGSKFSPTGGIRSGRIKERPSLNDVALTGRIDYFPFVNFDVPAGQQLRLGFSGYTGGVDNGDEGNNPDGLSGVNIHMASADFEYSINRFDLRGQVVQTWIDDADQLAAGVGEEMFGWYIEPAYHVMPDSWKKGRWEKSDLVLFTRYEEYDTQHKTVSGFGRVPGGEREELTIGGTLFFTPTIVFKADYQFVDSDADIDPDDRLNLGIGMQF